MNHKQKIETKFEDKPKILLFLSNVAHLLIQSIIVKKKKIYYCKKKKKLTSLKSYKINFLYNKFVKKYIYIYIYIIVINTKLLFVSFIFFSFSTKQK